MSDTFVGNFEVLPNESSLSNLLQGSTLIDSLTGDIVIVPEELTPSDLLTQVDIPVYDNLLQTVSSLNDNSPSNAGILDSYENIESIPVIPPGDGSVFPTDPSQLPEITTLEELLKYLSEIMIRFSSNPDYYMQDDYKLLIQTISNAFIYLYTKPDTQYAYDELWAAINNKVDKITGKGLSTHDLTDILKTAYDIAYAHSQLPHAPADAEKNVNPDWLALSGDAYIFNKPIISGTNTGDETKASIESKLTGVISSHSHTYKFTQSVASALWSITHNLGKFPSIVITDLVLNNYEGDIYYINENELQLGFSQPLSGYAYLN